MANPQHMRKRLAITGMVVVLTGLCMAAAAVATLRNTPPVEQRAIRYVPMKDESRVTPVERLLAAPLGDDTP